RAPPPAPPFPSTTPFRSLLRVRHCLVAARELELAQIETVLSHPQVPGQCSRFLREQLPQAAIGAAASTAEAVRTVVAANDGVTADRKSTRLNSSHGSISY